MGAADSALWCTGMILVHSSHNFKLNTNLTERSGRRGWLLLLWWTPAHLLCSSTSPEWFSTERNMAVSPSVCSPEWFGRVRPTPGLQHQLVSALVCVLQRGLQHPGESCFRPSGNLTDEDGSGTSVIVSCCLSPRCETTAGLFKNSLKCNKVLVH